MRAALLLILAAGCTGTETGNPGLDTQVEVVGRSSDELSVSIGPGPGIVIEEAWLSTDGIALRRSCDPATPADATIGGAFAVDLAMGLPAPLSAELEADAYCLLTTTLVPAATLPAGAPPELAASTLFLRGSRADGVAFVAASALSVRTDVRGAGDAFDVSEAQRSFILGFDLASMLAGVDFAGLPDPPPGEPIDLSSHPSVLAQLEASIAPAAALFADADEDLILDAEEEAAPIATHHAP